MAIIYGTNGKDRITGTSLNDSIYGWNGDDSLAGGAGADRLYGGSGDDELIGDDGNDRLLGQLGNDSLDGGAGWDVLNGGSGDDTMTGGTGSDVYVVDRPGDVVIEHAGQGVDTVISFIDFSLGENFERLTLIGAGDIDGTGNDVGNVIRGNRGSNLLVGEGGNDLIVGNAGNDALDGGSGRDTVRGGLGADEIVFADGDFAGMTATTADRILDFSQAQGDTINLELVDADTLSELDQAFQFIGTDGFNNVAGELRYEVVNGNTFVQGDTDGDGAADFAIRIDGLHTLLVSDFTL